MRRPLLNSVENPQLRDKVRALFGADSLMARPDEGGFLHHYAHGPGAQLAAAAPVLESALRALERVSDGNPYPRPAP
jgi:hypothetical protein